MVKLIWQKLGTYIFNGLITLLPLLITVWIFTALFRFADGILGVYIAQILGRKIPGMGILVTLVILIGTGYLTTYIFGKRLVDAGEKILARIPLINGIYASAKQINELLFMQKETKAFRKVCAVEYPRKGVWAIAFLTGEGPQDVTEKTKTELYTVFVPTSPTPATGFVITVPKNEVIMLDMRLEDAVKLLVSGGVLAPKKNK